MTRHSPAKRERSRLSATRSSGSLPVHVHHLVGSLFARDASPWTNNPDLVLGLFKKFIHELSLGPKG